MSTTDGGVQQGEQATAELPGRVARDGASKVDALLIYGVAHDDGGARELLGGASSAVHPEGKNIAREANATLQLDVLVLLQHLSLALGWEFRELCWKEVAIPENIWEALDSLLDACFQAGAVGGGGLLLAWLHCAVPDAPTALYQEPPLVAQDGWQATEPLESLYIIVADVPRIAKEARRCECDH